MPKDFERCQQQGGKMRTMSGPNKMMRLEHNQYMHICIMGGKVHRGEIKTKKKKK